MDPTPIAVTIHQGKCQNPEPRDSHWRELNYPNDTSTMRQCMAACSKNEHATGFQFNLHDHFCGCLSVAPGRTMDELIEGPNVFDGSCVIGVFHGGEARRLPPHVRS